MLPLSIVILVKNEEKNIERCLKPLLHLTTDLIVVDTGCEDKTADLAKNLGAKVISLPWEGYSATKNKANQFAVYNWILSLDADEEMNQVLAAELHKVFSGSISPNMAFLIRRKLIYEGKILNYGSVSNEYRIRLFNKSNARWNRNEVHEDIELMAGVQLKKLNGFVYHHSYSNKQEHLDKLKHYAALFAKQKKKEGGKYLFKMIFSPVFGFVKNYIFRLGFLDGAIGFRFAWEEMSYTFRKYQLASQ